MSHGFVFTLFWFLSNDRSWSSFHICIQRLLQVFLKPACISVDGCNPALLTSSLLLGCVDCYFQCLAITVFRNVPYLLGQKEAGSFIILVLEGMVFIYYYPNDVSVIIVLSFTSELWSG